MCDIYISGVHDVNESNKLAFEEAKFTIDNYRKGLPKSSPFLEDKESPCEISNSPFKNCLPLNPIIQNEEYNTKTIFHMSILYIADVLLSDMRDYGDLEDIKYFANKENLIKVVLKKKGVCRNIRYFDDDEEVGINTNKKYKEKINNNIHAEITDNYEGEIMKYLDNSGFKYMPKLINSNWRNTGWIVMEYYDGISLQEFYRSSVIDIDDIHAIDEQVFEERLIYKAGPIYKALNELLVDRSKDEISGSTVLFNLALTQFIAISSIYVEMLKKGVLHCNPSPSSIMLRRGRLGINPNDIIFVDYSQSLRWSPDITDIFFSNIRETCIPDLRPILSFLLADFGKYIPLSSIDVTFFGQSIMAPVNSIFFMTEQFDIPQCRDYNELLREYYNSRFRCSDLLVDAESIFHTIDCHTLLPANVAIPLRFKVFHFCQYSCNICNKGCERMMSLLTNSLDDNVDKNEEIDLNFISGILKYCKPNLDIFSEIKLSNEWINQEWTDAIYKTAESRSNSVRSYKKSSLLGCRHCIQHQKVIQSLLFYFEIPSLLVYPYADLFIGDREILINSHKKIVNIIKQFLLNKNSNIFQNILSKPNTQNELPGNYINKLKDLSIKNNLLVLLLLGSRYTGLSSENNLELLHEYTHTPSGLLHLRIANDAPNYLYLQLIRQSFKFYMQNRFSSEYKYRILQMIRIFSKRLLPVSTRSFPLFRRPESIS
ncbi:hypothetical protein cand_008960 [Cryptosporidium andersoni]|uniref:Protein kinase domain-containing protein n=1 Tax=Cryptosporidium andersoni TaxID=117008 RepID=A0A1J4MWW6_9CRYT|nr:hypothetical protein cand_008960 [Cryptosporidium andersoni]